MRVKLLVKRKYVRKVEGKQAREYGRKGGRERECEGEGAWKEGGSLK